MVRVAVAACTEVAPSVGAVGVRAVEAFESAPSPVAFFARTLNR